MILSKITCQAATEPRCLIGSVISPGYQVPLLERPESRSPPVPAGSPGPISTFDVVPLLPENEEVRLLITHPNGHSFCWPQLPHSDALRSRFRVKRSRRGYSKRFDAKGFLAMRVFEHHLPRAAVANNAANARQGYIQPHWLWHLWRKKSKLH